MLPKKISTKDLKKIIKMDKKWFCKELRQKNEVTNFLNKLSLNGIPPCDIKLGVSGSSNWPTPVVWYFSALEMT